MERIDLGPMGCPRCGEAGRLYLGDKLSRDWLRYECSQGHWSDIAPSSSLIPEKIKTKLEELRILPPPTRRIGP